MLVALSAGLEPLKERTVTGLKAYVSGIVSHKVCDARRGKLPGHKCGLAARSLDSTVTNHSDAGPLGQFLSASGPGPRTKVMNEELSRRALAALATLEACYREAIILGIIDQLPPSQIAQIMNITREAAAMLLIRAVRALREGLSGSSTRGGGDGLCR